MEGKLPVRDDVVISSLVYVTIKCEVTCMSYHYGVVMWSLVHSG